MSKMVKWGILLLLTTFLTTLALQDNGKVSIVWGDWIIETSLSLSLVLVAVGIVTLIGLVRFWSWLVNYPSHWRQTRALKRQYKAERTMSKGLVAIEFGDWKQAEKQLIKSAKYSDSGLMNFLSAAKMAHNQGALDRQDQYFAQAKAAYPEEMEMIGLIEARLISDQTPKEALIILETLFLHNTTNRAVLAEFSGQLARQENWEKLAEILPYVRSSSAIDNSEIDRLEGLVAADKVANATDSTQLEALWQTFKPNKQLQPNILAEFVEQKIGWGQEAGLAALIVKSLKKQWNDRLVYQYGRLRAEGSAERLKVAESWLKQHPDEPVLLLTLGRLACQTKLWTSAHNYFKASLALKPEVETYHALAGCYEQEGLESQAALTYKQAVQALEKKR